MKKDPKIFLLHILESIEAIEKYVKKMNKKDFIIKPLVQDAVIRRLIVIGEAAKNVPSDYKRQNPHIRWRDVGDMRNKIIHEYFGIDLNLVWEVVNKDIRELKKEVLGLLK